MYINDYASPIGKLTLASDGIYLTGLWIEGQRYYGYTLKKDTVRQQAPVFEAARDWLDAYFAGDAPDLSLPLAPMGTPFQQQVWQILKEIPYGTTTTYGDIAREVAARLGKPSMSAQAVGGAVGHNPISIIIPCHRVLGANGSLTGYAGGIDRKEWLLCMEKSTSQGFPPSRLYDKITTP